MASRKVSVLKFVGTISVGLLTGASYTLSAVTIPALLELPSASAAAKAFRSLKATAKTHLNALQIVASSAFLLAYTLSPRGYRHPYLLYTSLFVLGTRLPAQVTAFVSGASTSSTPAASQRKEGRKEKQAARRMEASYEVLGDSHSEEGAATSGEEGDEEVNGEEVRGDVESFVKSMAVQTAVTGIGFIMAVVGIWGDAVYQVPDVMVIEY